MASKDQKPGAQDVPGSEKGLGPNDPINQTPGAGTATASGRTGATGAGMGTDLMSPEGAAPLKSAGPSDIMPGTGTSEDASALRARVAELEARLGIPSTLSLAATNPNAPSGKHRYRVRGPGAVKYMGVFYKAGAEIVAGAADAQGLDESLEYVGPVLRVNDSPEVRAEKERQGEHERKRMDDAHHNRRREERAAQRADAAREERRSTENDPNRDR